MIMKKVFYVLCSGNQEGYTEIDQIFSSEEAAHKHIFGLKHDPERKEYNGKGIFLSNAIDRYYDINPTNDMSEPETQIVLAKVQEGETERTYYRCYSSEFSEYSDLASKLYKKNWDKHNEGRERGNHENVPYPFEEAFLLLEKKNVEIGLAHLNELHKKKL
ncbi:unnamed protein product [Sphagnum jensenii]